MRGRPDATFLSVIAGTVLLLVLTGGSVTANQATKDVIVRNTANESVPVWGTVDVGNDTSAPVPVAPQGTTNVAGSVAVSNWPDEAATQEPARIGLDDDPLTDDPPNIYTVPEGKRLVVEHVNSFGSSVVTPMWELIVQDIGSGHGGSSYHFLGERVTGCSPDCYVMNEAVHFYADQGDRLIRGVGITGNSILYITGYLIDLPS